MNKLLKMGATWCTACKAQTKIFENDVPPMDYEEVDIDKNLDLARTYRIRSVPTLLIIDENGGEVKRHVGVLTKDKYENFFN